MTLRFRDVAADFFRNTMGVKRVLVPRDDYALQETLKYLREAGGTVDVALEVHHNAAASPSATGHEVFISPSAPLWLIKGCQRMLMTLSKLSGLPSRGVKYSGASARGRLAWVDEGADAAKWWPRGVLVELGFLSNPKDLAWIKSDEALLHWRTALEDAFEV